MAVSLIKHRHRGTFWVHSDASSLVSLGDPDKRNTNGHQIYDLRERLSIIRFTRDCVGAHNVGGKNLSNLCRDTGAFLETHGAKTQTKRRGGGTFRNLRNHETPEVSKVSERFQASLARFAFAHWHLSNQKSKAPGHDKATTTQRRPRNQDHAKESNSPIAASSRVKDLRTRKRSISALGEGPNEPVGRLEPGSPSKKQKRGYAEPSTYAHLRELRNHLRSGLEVFCGINPGQTSAEIGHHFGGPTNHFWSCLYESGFTTRLLRPQEDFILPEQFSIGMTNLVDRPTAEQSELSKAERLAGVPALLAKIATHRPKIVCFVGLGIADIVKSKVMPVIVRLSSALPPLLTPRQVGKGRKTKAAIGIQPYKLQYQGEQACPKETLFYAVSSTSGRVVTYQKKDKVNQFKALKSVLESLRNNNVDTSSLHALQLNDLQCVI
ncbi:uncharacterized protein LACBIDRAFT_316334 [Laccaria bicolor S238N-H82]|uniref:Predicted protein n=1 Tax=Laccaria bicolor (strain S238N-H82 / ATCC MYA-4686) TaxID=486041 RepID=B0E0R1_LACBS|nr:uncharacterized protein LACBIDRAFT_316334 [Laccaria bicolor S238N-H82]EDQ99546.1 predicted protein [Laccaria bicolor S238N-H82]|eukprot:XP_001889770.1 predicted protein [Laccaria bicolor S238N-H82]